MAYNGWSNYETWNIKLWMDNDEGSYRYWLGETQAVMEENEDREDAIQELAKRLKAEHHEHMPELSGPYSDLLSSALSEVDWHEIASSLIEDQG